MRDVISTLRVENGTRRTHDTGNDPGVGGLARGYPGTGAGTRAGTYASLEERAAAPAERPTKAAAASAAAAVEQANQAGTGSATTGNHR